MSQPGIGAMLHYLSGGSANDPEKYLGMTIETAELIADGYEQRLRLKLNNGYETKTIDIWDNGQSCCERRYMTTDDDVQSLVGCVLTRIDSRAGIDEDDEYGVHETCFVEVGTNKGFITLINHNEHNGCYGGFGLTITESENV